jgi:hypothetical protein
MVGMLSTLAEFELTRLKERQAVSRLLDTNTREEKGTVETPKILSKAKEQRDN